MASLLAQVRIRLAVGLRRELGNPQLPKQVYCTPLVHPASILRSRWGLEPAQQTYLRRVADAYKAQRPPEIVDINTPPPGTILYPTLDQLEAFGVEARSMGAVAIDIENAGEHIICVGLTAFSLDNPQVGSTICLRFRRRGGALWWTRWDEFLRAVRWLYDLLRDGDVAKAFHNGVVHDVPHLERVGFKVRGRLIDTMTLAHVAYSEFPKSLQFCGTLYLGVPVWKVLTSPDDEEEGKA